MQPAQHRTKRAEEPTQLGSVLERLAATRFGDHTNLPAFERRILATALNGLGMWLIEQARMLDEEDAAPPDLGRRTHMHVVPLPLTQREREVVVRIAAGASNRQIARDLVITNSTVERHMANILGKLGMRSRSQVAVWAVREGLAEAG